MKTRNIQTTGQESPAVGAGSRRQPHALKIVLNIQHPASVLNHRLDRLPPFTTVNETLVLEMMARAESFHNTGDPLYALTLARIAEMALITAGNYADACEFQAAGDLLANPIKVKLHVRGRPGPIIKQRHKAVSEQLNENNLPRKEFLKWLKHNVITEIAEQAPLRELFSRMENTGLVSGFYLDRFQAGMKQVSDTIGFLSAWQTIGIADLYTRMQTACPRTRRFIQTNLCGFTDALFVEMGREIRALETGEAYTGQILKYSAARKYSA